MQYTEFDRYGNVIKSYSVGDIPKPSYGYNIRKKESQKSSEATWLRHKGEEVYLTWHIHEKKSQTFSSPPILREEVNKKSYDYDEREYYTYRQSLVEGIDSLSAGLSTETAAMLSRLDNVAPQYTDSELITLAKAAANSAEFDLGTFIGEMPEVIRFAGNLVLQISHLLGTLRLKKVGKPTTRRNQGGYRVRDTDPFVADGIEVSTDAWLAYRYAVIPLVYSLEGALKALEPPEPVFTRARIRSTGEGDYSSSRTLKNGRNRKYEVYTQGATQVIGRAQVYTMLSAADVKKRKVLLDLATTSWELVPYSFVVDWVLQVGSFLQAIRQPPCQSQGITISEKRTLNILSTATGIDSTSGNVLSGQTVISWSSNQTLSTSHTTYRRSVVDFHLPTIPVGVRLNFSRVVDAFALSFQSSRGNLISLKRGRG